MAEDLTIVDRGFGGRWGFAGKIKHLLR